jgi:thermostable 8-oxoguanine DNA glycosylase
MIGNEDVHAHSTRQKSDAHVQYCRTTLFKNSSANMGIKLYNKLPNEIKKLEKLQDLKKKLRHFLLQQTFYSVDEHLSY